MDIQKDEKGIEKLPFYTTRHRLVQSGCLLEFQEFGKELFLHKRVVKEKVVKIKENKKNRSRRFFKGFC
jgi:hypothetical protein